MSLLPLEIIHNRTEESVDTAPWLNRAAAAPQGLAEYPLLNHPYIGAATEAVEARWSRRPRLGLILGTGLGHLASLIEAEATIPYHEIPHFACSTALAHKGQFVGGLLNGVAVLAMQGRCHAYEGYSLNQLMLPVFVMRALGAETLLVTNAAGGVNPRFAVGDVMVMEDHINCMGMKTCKLLSSAPGRSGPCYDPRLMRRAELLARKENLPLQRGVYVGVTGPNYETRAEYRFFRQIGGDAVGMSTVPEALAARACGLKTLALSTITNVARPDAPQTVNMHDVVSVAERAEPVVRRLVAGMVESIRQRA